MRPVRILIAEDDRMIRAGLWRMVERYFQAARPGLFTIYEAGNGRDAYQICVGEGIDILITDIKMPLMDGVALVGKLQETGHPAQVLAISGYEDYAYVRQMLRLGAHDYLIKPIDETQVTDALSHFMRSLAMPDMDGAALMGREQRLVEALLLNAPTARQSLMAFLLRAGLTKDAPCEVLFLRVDERPQTAVSLYRAVHTYALTHPQVTTLQGGVNLWVVVCLLRGGGAEEVGALLEHVRALGYAVHRRLPLPRAEALLSLHQRLRSAFYDLEADTAGSGETVQAALGALYEMLLGGGGAQGIPGAVRRLFACYQQAQTPPDAIRRDLTDLQYRAMSQSPDIIEFVSKARFTPQDLAECFSGAASLAVLRGRVEASLLHLAARMEERRLRREDSLFAQAKAFIDANFSSDLQLAHVAERVHLHPNYFSTLFRDAAGITFRAYLRQVRIEAAQRLIRTGELPMHAVAERVGYGDTAHFFRAFKKVTGMTPRAWRQNGP